MLKSFQLRIARSVTGIGVREVALYLNVSRTIISRWENSPPLEIIKTKKASSSSLIFFFKQHGILFPNENTVSFIGKPTGIDNKHLTRFQLRAARSALYLTQQKLAELTNTSISYVNYLETQDNMTFLNETNKEIDDLALKGFFQNSGIIFPDNLSIVITNNTKFKNNSN